MSGYFQKTLIAIENSIAKKEFYHALQLIKSMVFRYQNTQTYEEALDFLIQNINKFMEFNEVESAVELCNMYMDIIEKNHGLNTDKIFHDLLKIVQFMTISHKLWRPFQSRISEYLKKLNNSSYTAQIEQAYAFLFLDAGNCELARFHSFNIQDSSVLCDFLLKYSQKFIQQEELDLFLLQFVLLTLNKNNYVLASGVFYNFMRTHPSLNHNYDFPYKIPTLNFIHLLFRTLSGESYDQFVVLIEIYEPTWSLDSCNKNLLENIKKSFFSTRITNAPTPTPPPSTFPSINGIMGMINTIFPLLTGSAQRTSTTSTQQQNTTTDPPNNSTENDDLVIDLD